MFYDGFELLKSGKAQEAAAKFEAGLESDPKNASALYYLGEAYRQQGKDQEAQARFQASLDADQQRRRRRGQAGPGRPERCRQARQLDPAKYPAAGSTIKDCVSS